MADGRNVLRDFAAKHMDGIPNSALGVPEILLKDSGARLFGYGVSSSMLPIYTPPPPDPAFETNGQLYKMNARVEGSLRLLSIKRSLFRR